MATNNPTLAANLVDPEVLANILSYTLNQQLRFTALAQVDDTLVGQPGDTQSFPFFRYAGDAQDLQEGVAIDIDNITADVAKVTIKEAGKGIGVTDTAVKTGFGDPFGEAAKQAGLSMAKKIDDDLLGAIKGVTQLVAPASAATVEGLQKALDLFADEDDTNIVLVCSPNAASALRLDAGSTFTRGSELGAQMIVSGTYGELLGVQIVRTSKLKAGEAYLVKIDPIQPALKLVKGKDITIETMRHAEERQTNIIASAMYAPYVFDESKIVKIGFTGLDAIERPARRQDKPKAAKTTDATTNSSSSSK